MSLPTAGAASTTSSSTVGAVTSVVTGVVSGLVSGVTSVTGVIDDGEKLVTEGEKIIEQQTSLNNTPAMIANDEAQKIAKLRQEIEAETANNDVTIDRQGAGS